jgi:hypothetical protein
MKAQSAPETSFIKQFGRWIISKIVRLVATFHPQNPFDFPTHSFHIEVKKFGKD